MPKALDLTDQKFGKLTAIERLPSRNGKTYWLCKCECGNRTQVQTGHLRSGAIISCGCAHALSKAGGRKTTIMDSISDEEFSNIVESSSSLREIASRCGYSNNSGASSNIVKRRIEKQGLDFQSTHVPNIQRTDEEIFIEDSPVSQSVLRQHYKNGNYSEYKCAICGLKPVWSGQELVLTLDHINGKNHDDRLENLRWVCPNCDRQLDTFAGRNIKYQKSEKYCVDCGAPIIHSSTRCPVCAAKERGFQERRAIRPDRDTLKFLIRTQSFVQIGTQYGVSDNTIRKWCDAEGLPRKKKEIAQFSDKEWLMV